MTTTFAIQLADTAAALERLLRMIRVRGFYVENCQVSQHEEAGYAVRVTVSGSRCLRNLQQQLGKLHEVVLLEVVVAEQDRAAVPA